MIESYTISNIGDRTENQDRVLADHSLRLFAVADGMGGHRGGSTAAEMAIVTLRYFVESSRDPFDISWPFGYIMDLSANANRMTTGIRLANGRIWAQAQTTPHCAGMGTTVAAVLLSDSTAVIGSVGDSRVYLLRGGDLLQLTPDDTVCESPSNETPVDQNASLAMRHMLTQAVGYQEMIDVHICEQTLRHEDLFLIASDGLHGVLEDAAIRSILGAGVGIQRTAEHLLEAAVGRHATDNTSLVVLGYDR